MSNSLMGKLISARDALKRKVSEYDAAIRVAQEHAMETNGRAKARSSHVVHRAAKSPKPVLMEGTLLNFVKAHVDTQASPASEAKRLVALAKSRDGVRIKRSSTLSSIRVARKIAQEKDGVVDVVPAIADYLRQFGPMPFKTLRGWFDVQFPTLNVGGHRALATRLAHAQLNGSVKKTDDGQWAAV